MPFRFPRRRAAVPLVRALLVCALATVPAVRAAAQAAFPDATGASTWDMALEQANRRCRLNLTRVEAAGGYAVMMPAGCRRAFPLLSGVTSWTPGDDEHILLRNGTGEPVLDFGPASGNPFLQAVAGEGYNYTLTPTDQDRQAAIAAVRPADLAPVPAPAPPKPSARGPAAAELAPAPKPAPVRAATVGEVAGYYAVLRQHRDSGCMVTLDAKDRGPNGSLKAQLAPACADQGIVVFDPVGWQLARGELVLIARKGHTTELAPQDDGTWANAPAAGRVLTLKRL